MDKRILEHMNHEVIVLSDLKDIERDLIYDYFDQKPNGYYFRWNDSDEEKPRTEEEKKEILEKKNKLKKKSLELYYKIDNQIIEELKSAFNQLTLKAKFDGKPKILREGILYTLSNSSFIMYDNKFFKKSLEIKFDPSILPISAIQLDNNDLVFACSILVKNNWNRNYELLIYRLKEQKYHLFQKIKEDGFGYLSKYGNDGFCGNTAYKIEYEVNNLKAISGYRFICISNYGIKIYSLNENNEYSLILINEHLNDIKIIHEIKDNKFIFCTQKSLNGTYWMDKEILIEMIELNKVTKKELDDKFIDLKKYGYHLKSRYSKCFYFRNEKEEKNEINIDELRKLLESLKLTCSFKEIIKYTENAADYYLSNYVILKKKYFIVMINNNIFIINLIDGKIIKRYEILIDSIIHGKDSLFIYNYMEIQKWNNVEDNEFVLFIDKNVILFEINKDENNIINIKILNYLYFPNIIDGQYIKKLSEKQNKFYSYNRESSHIISIF